MAEPGDSRALLHAQASHAAGGHLNIARIMRRTQCADSRIGGVHVADLSRQLQPQCDCA